MYPLKKCESQTWTFNLGQRKNNVLVSVVKEEILIESSECGKSEIPNSTSGQSNEWHSCGISIS